ncbi:DUF3054 domain-containing protein [Arthrobacter sp. Sa2CUA1]|uniref:DUF3054 domain-containing protein n=1 Tax=Arthrobacter gallicola TaxID=2762225 RepID=A0ABR8UNP9_9MICC|nr:DUF3054 domain-containing protein [Arthrobacter gallicola]MBD7994168.1 DUF3054 domain-containing protein [Arthrobacter gallicola]
MTSRLSRFWPAFLATDVVLIITFAALGRDTHAHGLDPAGVLLTASPFIAACLGGWLVLRVRRRPAALWPTGVSLWLITAGAGLVIRVLAGGGIALSFALVTFGVLAAFLLLPRAVCSALAGGRARRDSTRLGNRA